MPTPSNRSRRSARCVRIAMAVACAAMPTLATGVNSSPAQDAQTDYSQREIDAALPNGLSGQPGTAPARNPRRAHTATPTDDTIVFTVDRRDRHALAAKRRADATSARARGVRAIVARDEARIDRIEELIAAAEEQEARLGSALEERAVSRYMNGGDDGDLAFVLSGSSLADALERANLVADAAEGDERLADDHRLTVEQLEELRSAAEALRDAHAEQAALLESRASDLSESLVSARMAHVDRSTSIEVEEPAGATGTWFVHPGELPWSVMLPQGGGYDGGTRTPARPPTMDQITAILNDPRIDIYAGGRIDIEMGRVDGRLLDALMALADQFGAIHITSLISGHGVYTTSGNVSEHAFGCAADIGSVSDIVIQPSTQGPGTITERAVLFLSGLQGDLGPHQVISLNSYGGPSLAMADHYDHIHLGYHC